MIHAYLQHLHFWRLRRLLLSSARPLWSFGTCSLCHSQLSIAQLFWCSILVCARPLGALWRFTPSALDRSASTDEGVWCKVGPLVGCSNVRRLSWSVHHSGAPALGACLLWRSAAPTPGHCSSRSVAPPFGCSGALPLRFSAARTVQRLAISISTVLSLCGASPRLPSGPRSLRRSVLCSAVLAFSPH